MPLPVEITSPNRVVSVNQSQFENLQRMLENTPKGIEKVMTRAVNKVGVSARKEIVDEVKGKVNIPVGEMKRRNIKLIKASYRDFSSTIKIRGSRIPLISFKANQTKRGVSYKIARTGPRKLAPGSFIATMKSGHRGVFKRVTAEQDDRSEGTGAFVPNTAANYDPSKAKRLPIVELKGPSIPQVFGDIAKFAKRVHEDKIAIKLQKELAIQMEVLIDQGKFAG